MQLRAWTLVTSRPVAPRLPFESQCHPKIGLCTTCKSPTSVSDGPDVQRSDVRAKEQTDAGADADPDTT